MNIIENYHWLCKGLLATANLLLDTGVDVKLASSGQLTALSVAVNKKHENVDDSVGSTPLAA